MNILIAFLIILSLLAFLKFNTYNLNPITVEQNINDIQSNTESETENNFVYLDVTIGNKLVGRMIIELFTDIVPFTSDNFKQLCEKGMYNGTPFHRIIPGFMIQGGDFTNGNGTGGYSIYGNKFPDENFAIKHDRGGLLSMANSGPNTNGSQFFITLAAQPHLDGKHVVFGQVVKGFEVMQQLAVVATQQDDQPLYPCQISSCGLA